MSIHSRRQFLQTTGALTGASLWARGVSRAAAALPERPDILFIAIEDVSPHRFGCYGSKVGQTPNMDKFAATGLRFAEAHTNPPCCPSRTALFLAKRPETTHVYGNRDDWHKLYPRAVPMPVHLRNHGYETIRCGKMYHGSFEDDASWTRVIDPNEGLPRPKPPKERPVRRGPGEELAAKAKREGLDPKQLMGGSPFSYGPTGREDADEKDGRVAEQGIRILRSRKPDDKPMMLCLGMHATHLGFFAPKKYFDLYPPEKMVVPRNPDADANGMPPEGVFKPHNPHTLQQWREAIAAHLACLTFVDAQVGRVLDALDETGRADNTIVVLWSDHGFLLGEHFLWRKGPLYDYSTQVAWLWRVPGVTKPGSVCTRPVETLDLFPTLFDLCGVPQPEGIEACSMKPLLEDPSRPWKKGALMCGNGGRSIVTEEWRYNEYPPAKNRPPELFNQKDDPGEFNNLAGDPKYAGVVAKLSGLLKGGWQACLPA